MEAMKKCTAIGLLAFTFGACGGESDGGSQRGGGGGGSRVTDAELATEIERTLGELNQCTTVEDCVSVSYPLCSSSFIGQGGDRGELDELLAEWSKRQGDIGCPAICRCGELSCSGGRCAALESDCMGVPSGSLEVCL